MTTFTFQLDKSDKMTIWHKGRAVTVLKQRDSLRLSEKLNRADEIEQQRLLAAATGNYKRGNEKT